MDDDVRRGGEEERAEAGASFRALLFSREGAAGRHLVVVAVAVAAAAAVAAAVIRLNLVGPLRVG